ncbi:Programmed cell death protein 6 [Orchesella cincta]|uniref:Programmed cell death protein 6 n=1 Tax=Orchesella cincta TaxID=48709 RepID=A0A1D2N370_ORCCI|nr:Programmed cell death protein 6 [Orchesella cincta]
MMGQTSPSAPAQRPTVDMSQLSAIFRSVDADNNGEIDGNELTSALSNGTWVPFNPQTVKLMIRMFDRRGSGTIRFEEFGSLWKYVQDWQACFQTYDRDNSGFIDCNELHSALTAFGYSLSPSVAQLMVKQFDRQHRGSTLAFDDFIHCCVMLCNITEAFKQLDQDRDGIITIQYEQFLYLLLNLIIN